MFGSRFNKHRGYLYTPILFTLVSFLLSLEASYGGAGGDAPFTPSPSLLTGRTSNLLRGGDSDLNLDIASTTGRRCLKTAMTKRRTVGRRCLAQPVGPTAEGGAGSYSELEIIYCACQDVIQLLMRWTRTVLESFRGRASTISASQLSVLFLSLQGKLQCTSGHRF